MVGPRVTFSIAGMRVAVGAVDLVLALLVLIGVLHERFPALAPRALIVPIGLGLVVLWFSINMVSERVRARIARSGPPALPTIVTLPVTHAPTVAEAQSTMQAARGGVAGLGVDLAIGLVAIAVFLLVDGTSPRLGELISVAAIAIGGSAAIRILAAPSLNGGRLLRWMFEFTFDDEENAIRALRMMGYGVAFILFTFGILLLTTDGEGGFWGVGLAAAGIDIGVLATVATRQTLWLRTATERTLGDLLEAPHALLSAASPLEEMLSVLSVDGPGAVAVVRDAGGQPAGIMQFRQMRAGLGKGKHDLTIGEVMLPIESLPLVSRRTSLLDAAHVLLASGAPALRFENVHGKTVIATARDLGLPR